MDSPKKSFKISLFYRVLMGTAIPLLVLLCTFSFFLLKRELTRQKIYYFQHGRETMRIIDAQLSKMPISEMLAMPETIRNQFEDWKSTYEIEKIDLIDPRKEISLLDQTPLKLNRREQSDILESLEQRRKEKPTYKLTENKQRRMLMGYLPVVDRRSGYRVVVVSIAFHLASIQDAIDETLRILIFLLVTVLLTSALISFRLSVQIINPIKRINKAFQEIRNGKLGAQVKIETGDELEEMAENFNEMSNALKVMQQQAGNSNPLTKLPGNDEIFKELRRRLKAKMKFVFFHIDIDHFKPYNDRYGLAAGDKVLRRTSKIIKDVLAETGSDQNFVGHQGGDDFILILDPFYAPVIGDRICKKFDASMVDFFSKEDLEKGFYTGEDSRNNAEGESTIKRHRLMSITLAGVSNEDTSFDSVEDIMTTAVAIKKRAKKIPLSKYLINSPKPTKEPKMF